MKSRRFDRAARLVFFDGRHSRSAWLLRRTVLGPIALLTALSLISQLGPPMPRSPESVVRLDESHIRRVSGPAPSGADPIYPPNHTLDGKVESLGAAPNADFEAPSVPVGSPPTNSDLEAPAVDVVTVPNGDFEAGTFANWTTSGSPTIQSDSTHGYWAKMASTATITSAALAIPSSAQALVYDVGYLTTPGTSWVRVYAYSGPTFGTSTLLKEDYCTSCGYWSTSYINVSAYRGQTIKIGFSRYSGSVGIDNVKIQQVFPGFDVSGDFARAKSGGNTYASVSNGGQLTSPAVTVDPATQTGTVQLKGSATTAKYEIWVAPGPDFATFTKVVSGTATTNWQPVHFGLGTWRGQQVKVRIKTTSGWIYSDDVAGGQLVEVPNWDVTGTTTRVDDGAGGHYASTDGTVTSAPIALPSGVQNVTLRLRGPATVSFAVEVLRGADFSTVVGLGSGIPSSSWATLSYGLGPYAGETVKLRVRRSLGTGSLDADDLGQLQSVLPGWTPTTTGGLDTGEDAYGTYLDARSTAFAVDLRSGWISTATVDRNTSVDGRYYAISYDIGYSTSNLLTVDWINEAGHSWRAYQDAANTPTGYRTRYFPVYDFMGARGYFLLHLSGGGRVYSIADNVAREQLSEPFSRHVGLGIDTSTGAVAFADQDLSVAGPLPLTFTRYYNSHSDRVGSLGYRWSDTYDTRLEFASGGDTGVIFGSGREEFFDQQTDGSYLPVDPRTHSALVKNGDGTYTLSTKDNLAYQFSALGALTRIEDLNGNAITLAYDPQGRLASVTGAGGRTLSMSYDPSGRLSTVTDPMGAVFTYAYDSSGDLVSVADPEGGVRTYTYSRHRLATVTDEGGNLVVENTYDDLTRVTAQTDAAGKTITVAYDSPGKGATRITDPEGGVATYYFDRFARTTDAVDPVGGVVTYLYDSSGNLDKVIYPADDAWDYTFDSSGDLTSSTDPLGNPVSITYNPKHLPTSVTDSRGNVATLTYDSAGNMTSRTDPLGDSTTYTYDGAGNLTSTTDSLGRTTSYTYDAAGDLTSKTDPLGHTWSYTYNGVGELTSKTDPLGNTTRYYYDLVGRLVLEKDPLLRETSFLYDPPGHLLMVQDPPGNQTTWGYDDRGLVISKTDPGGQVTTYGYDANRNMTSITDPLGNTTTYGYDDAGRLTSITDPLGAETAYTYDPDERVASETDPLGRATSYDYDAAGRLTAVTLPGGGALSYAYDGDGRLTSRTDPLGHATTSGYDDAGRLASTTDPLGNTTTFGYDAAGQLVSDTDPLGHATTYGYDAAGRLTTSTDPLGDQTSYAYDDAGRMTAVTDPTGRTTSDGYDAAGELLTTTDPAGETTTSSYDAAGRLASVALPSGASTTYAYDSRGLLTEQTDPLLRSTTYSYDADQNLATETDPLGNVTTYGYDPVGRLTSITDALGGVVGLGYNAGGQLTSVTDPRGKTWTYGYDSQGDRTSVTDPLGRATAYGYDLAGQQTSRTDARGITASYGYDAAGEPTSIAYPGGSVAYAYDAAGRQTEMTDPTGQSVFTDDAAGRVTQVAAPEGTLSYGYDAAGRRTRMTLPGDRAVHYAYDDAGRLASLRDWGDRTTSFAYDTDGNRTGVSRPNGVTSAYAYDAAGEITSISHDGPTGTLLSFDYTYDSDGNRTGVTTTDGTETHTYDALGRLTHVTYPDGSEVAYTYDRAGNRTTETTDTLTTEYAYDAAGELTAAGGTPSAYDADGNLTARGPDSFSYDFDNRLTEASVGSHTASYTYDGDGVRVGATADGAESSLLVDREAGLPQVVDDGSSAYLHAGGLLGSVGLSGPTYALTDALGSVRGLADSSGALEETASYGAFGEVRTSSGASVPFGFAGEPTDTTGLTYLRARYLDPGSGRMLSPDTVFPSAPGTQGYNRYAYARDDPTTWTDPSGHLVPPPSQGGLAFLETVGEGGVATGRALAENPLWLAEVIESALPWECAAGGAVCLGAAIVLGFLVLACFFIGPCWDFLHESVGLIHNLGSISLEGQTSYTTGELEGAAQDYPGTPTVPEPGPEPSPLPVPCVPGASTCGGTSAQPAAGQTIYRVYGGGSGRFGQSWTPQDPREVQQRPELVAEWGMYAYRAVAGLPDSNTGERLIKAELLEPDAVTPTTSSPIKTKLDPRGEWPGGLPEYFFVIPPTPGVEIQVIEDIPLHPTL